MILPDWAATSTEAAQYEDLLPKLPTAAVRVIGADACSVPEPHLGAWFCTRRIGHGGRHTAASWFGGIVLACWTPTEPTA